MLLPLCLSEELRDSHGNVNFGFFLYPPFPAAIDWSVIPLNEQTLTGILILNLVRFHTPEYAHSLQNCCKEILYLPSFIML